MASKKFSSQTPCQTRICFCWYKINIFNSVQIQVLQIENSLFFVRYQILFILQIEFLLIFIVIQILIIVFSLLLVIK
jgi:hypothetical protein